MIMRYNLFRNTTKLPLEQSVLKFFLPFSKHLYMNLMRLTWVTTAISILTCKFSLTIFIHCDRDPFGRLPDGVMTGNCWSLPRFNQIDRSSRHCLTEKRFNLSNFGRLPDGADVSCLCRVDGRKVFSARQVDRRHRTLGVDRACAVA